MRMVVKVQTPLSGGNVCLIYDAHRKYMEQRTLTVEETARMGTDPKKYFNAIRKHGRWELLDEVGPQSW